jgi:ABC-type amino acid transport substrate-binding protein
VSREPLNPDRRRTLAAGALGLLAGLGLPAAAQTAAPTDAPAAPKALDAIRQRGRLTVAVYNDMPPFNVKGKGIDVTLAEALARQLGLPLSLLPFNADEGMNDDLRNMVWRGHYLGFGPADVLLHVPVDRPLMEANPRVQIFGAYYRERNMIARNLDLVPRLESLKDFGGKKIAVPGQSLAGWLLIGADDGAYREQLVTKLADGTDAARALQRGEVAGAAGLASELESVLRGDPRFAIDPLPVPRMRDGWLIGCAVKREAGDLAAAVQAAIDELAGSGRLAEIFAASNVPWRRA